ncbi:protein jag [Sediminivirga luteola]|jgi:spoIIIJ-associated protein|uniref:Single-stranded DNA-binding protein n=1 Tax=Sediminivirga luteola TaxID=1774748 RepID=A0A8J2TZE8_9MICO|nr:R3H domain-containing nucleic acid-binding protein [Sediminivirga luteola]MCI2266623.1 single-stranded DNA-binding protein [Sediminivirga luteola]GGA20219.1 single-stranded DNA-binding protein [Sediminivirga luteola]
MSENVDTQAPEESQPDTVDTVTADSTEPAESAPTLEDEGEIAADYLEEFLDIADLDGDIDIDVVGGRPHVAIVAEDADSRLRRLIGRDGEVLSALQDLTRLAVQSSTGERSLLMLDIAGHREQRRDSLKKQALAAIDEVKETGEQIALPPMNSFERKVVHDEVSAAGLYSESEGAGGDRHVVIRPKDD